MGSNSAAPAKPEEDNDYEKGEASSHWNILVYVC